MDTRSESNNSMISYTQSINLIERIFVGLAARIQNSLVDNPIYEPMPVYEQIVPQTAPQITTVAVIDESERATQPGPCTCGNHQENHLSRSENHYVYIDQPMCVQNSPLQLVNTTETLEHDDPMDQDTFFTEASAGSCVHSNLEPTLNLEGVKDCDIDIDIIDVSCSGDDRETTQTVSASSTTEQGDIPITAMES